MLEGRWENLKVNLRIEVLISINCVIQSFSPKTTVVSISKKTHYENIKYQGLWYLKGTFL